MYTEEFHLDGECLFDDRKLVQIVRRRKVLLTLGVKMGYGKHHTSRNRWIISW